MSLSERLGRSYSKEQYAYIYKFASVQMMTAEVYPDQHDTFEREPYVGLFKYRDGLFLIYFFQNFSLYIPLINVYGCHCPFENLIYLKTQ